MMTSFNSSQVFQIKVWLLLLSELQNTVYSFAGFPWTRFQVTEWCDDSVQILRVSAETSLPLEAFLDLLPNQ